LIAVEGELEPGAGFEPEVGCVVDVPEEQATKKTRRER
jgi:hypothetical protein